MGKEQLSLRERTRNELRLPRRYRVIIYNDDFTTMEFVIRILTDVFFLSEEEALQLALSVHQSGRGVVGVYSYDMAKSKVELATSMARGEGFPLLLSYISE